MSLSDALCAVVAAPVGQNGCSHHAQSPPPRRIQNDQNGSGSSKVISGDLE